MPASGTSPTARCAASTIATAFTPASAAGLTSSRGSRGWDLSLPLPPPRAPAALPPCHFSLLRYWPNTVRGEFVNLGVLLYAPADKRLLPPRLLENFARVRRLHPRADLDVLAGPEKQIEAEAAGQAANRAGTLDRLQQFSNALGFSEPKPG